MPEPGIDDAASPSSVTDRDDLRRSVRLFRRFLTEQTDPDGFYTLIADDAVRLMRPAHAPRRPQVADFGGGPGFYSEAFRAAGARSVVVDAGSTRSGCTDGATGARWSRWPSRRRWPTSSVDVAFSSNLMEHVPD